MHAHRDWSGLLIDGQVWGASVGDSGAWMLDGGEVLDLTENQHRKPLLGSGGVLPVAFGPTRFSGRLLLASDGLLKYVPAARISTLASTLPLNEVPEALTAAARLPSGTFQDDIAIIVAGHK